MRMLSPEEYIRGKQKTMNNKKTKRILVVLCLFLLAFAVVFGLRYFQGVPSVVTSSPSTPANATGESSVESIQDEAVPLAGGTVGEVVRLTTRMTIDPVDAPVIRPAAPTAAPTATPTAEPTATPTTNPTTEPTTEPTATPTAEPTATPTTAPTATPTAEPTATPTATPVVVSTAATRLLDRVNALLEQYNACTTNDEKKALLGAPNYSLGNDAFRTKVLADMGGSWEQLEEEVVDATEYQQDKTLYVQVYMSGLSSDFIPVVYTTQNPDRSGNQWSTNLVYDEEDAAWMEYTQKHPSNDSREGYYMTNLAKPGTYDALMETMETSAVWQEVVVPEPEEETSVASLSAESPPADPPADPPAEG